MRVYISADLEGVNGVVLKEHVDPGKKEYDLARQWMLDEVNAAIDGAVQGGADQIVVNDSHNVMANLPIDRLHSPASLITGPSKPFSMVQDLDYTFDAVIFLGYHAKFGTPQAVHDHIFSYTYIREVRVNDVSVGEIGLNAGMAGFYGVPVAMITGDRATVQEAQSLMPDIESVIVKEGRGRYAAFCYPFEETTAKIKQTAQNAVEKASEKNIFRFEEPLTLAVSFRTVEFADKAAFLPRTSRPDPFTLQYHPADYRELYQAFLAMYRLARS